MYLVDWIALGIILLTALLGLLLGFGKTLKIFTGGVFGIIISVVVTYFCIGIVASWGFVQNIMAKWTGSMAQSESKFVRFFYTIGVERILLGIILFAIIQVLRIIIVHVIKEIVEIDNPVIKAINRIGGMLFMLFIMFMLMLIVFHIVDLIGGATEESFINYLTGGLKLNWLFEHNPLKYIIQRAGQ